eukprot:6709840-Prymnesium_polylepis.2
MASWHPAGVMCGGWASMSADLLMWGVLGVYVQLQCHATIPFAHIGRYYAARRARRGDGRSIPPLSLLPQRSHYSHALPARHCYYDLRKVLLVTSQCVTHTETLVTSQCVTHTETLLRALYR